MSAFAAGTLVAGWSAAALAGPSDGYFADATSSLRSQNGLPAYRDCADLGSVANAWASHMAATRTLAHNPNYTSEVQGWSSVAENVGAGSSAAAVEQALENSAEHRGHLLSTTYTEAGYGTALAGDGTLYVDEVFRKPSGAPCEGSATAPGPAVASAPGGFGAQGAGAPAPMTPTTPSTQTIPTRRTTPTDRLRAALRSAEQAHAATGAVAEVFDYWELVRSLPIR